ncbi:MAG: purine-nucleoside phosphorylase [Candidatus Eisenbacteria bacterium]
MVRRTVDSGAAAAHLRARGFAGADAAVVLGSGLSSFADGLGDSVVVPYAEIPGVPATGVEGHAGAVVLGSLGGKRVLVFAGRVHFYEGRTHADVTWQVRLAAELGVPVLAVSNAAGGIDPGFRVGDVMLIVDQISMVTGRFRPRTGGTFRMADAYSPRLRGLAREAALAIGTGLREGVYLGSLGPTYETPAEIGMARIFGAQAVGMSTVAEVQAARSLGLEVLGLSLVTNVPLPGRFEETTHAEVLEAGRAGAATLLSLVAGIAAKL